LVINLIRRNFVLMLQILYMETPERQHKDTTNS